jgi:hypothetical protein
VEQQKRERQAQSLGMEIPVDYLTAVSTDDEKEKEKSEEDKEGSAGESEVPLAKKNSSKKQVPVVALQDLFMARLETVQSRQDETDDLANYENYIRSQYSALAKDIVSPRATSVVSVTRKQSSSAGVGSGGVNLRVSSNDNNNRRHKSRKR